MAMRSATYDHKHKDIINPPPPSQKRDKKSLGGSTFSHMIDGLGGVSLKAPKIRDIAKQSIGK